MTALTVNVTESDVSSEYNLQAMLKGILAQLLDSNVGDIGFYESLAKAYNPVLQPGQNSDTTEKLYKALFIGLQALSNTGLNVILLVDGVDHVGGVTPTKNIIKRLYETVKPLSRVESIFFSQTSMDEAHGLDQLTIKAEHVHDDIRRTFSAGLNSNPFFSKMPSDTQEKHLDSLSHRAKGSFIWATLTLTTILSCETEKSFFQVIEKPVDSNEKLIINILEDLDLQNQNIKHALLWSMVAKRPLTLQEMTTLLHLDVRTRSISERKIDISSLGKKLTGVMSVASGTFRFRHSFIRQSLFNYAERKKEFQPKSIEADFSQRLLLYVKLCLDDHSSEPSLDILEWRAVFDAFGAHCALEYCVRYWCQHFQHSSMYNSKGSLTLGEDFKSLFPSSCLFARYEWGCWGGQLATNDSLQLHEIALRVRQSVFSEGHVCVLQSFIVLGSIRRDLPHDEEASLHWYHAVQIAKGVLTARHSIVASLTTSFLACAELVAITTRTRLAGCKEEMLKLIIEISIHQYGRTSDVVIRYHRQLINLYLTIQEHEHATDWSHRLYDIIVIRFGKSSKEATEVSDELVATLKNHTTGRKGNIEFRKSLFENSQDTMEIWDLRRIRMTLDLAWEYEAYGDIILAEETLIQLWLHIAELCVTKRTSEILIAKLDIAFAYVEFLQRVGRVEEARAILICFWEEHQRDAHLSEMLALRFKALATLMKSFGLLTVAMNVFSAVWSFFKKKNKCEHKEALAVTILISETVEEVISTTTTTTVETQTVTKVSTVTEAQLVEIFETFIINIKKYKAYTQVIQTCKALVSIYFSLQHWTKAINILTRTLEVSWEVFLRNEGGGEFHLPKDGGSSRYEEIILICLRYAECHQHQHNSELAEKYYLRIYHSCLRSLHITDKHFQLTYTALINFYEHYHQHDKAIAIYIELLERCRRDLGASHNLTIQILYKLGGLCMRLGRKEAYSYYLEIATVLNKGLTHCHHDALEASIILSKWFFETQQWKQCHEQCRLIWATVCHDNRDRKDLFSMEFIMTISERYITVCRYHVKVEYTILRKLVEEYRELSVRLFGEMAMISISAMIQVATILELKEESHYEAVAIYEEVIKKLSQLTVKSTKITTTTTTTTTVSVSTVRKKLTKLYVTITRSSMKCSHETLQRAITLCEERFIELKMELGVWHSATLEVLTEMIMLQRRLDTKESHAHCVHLLGIHFLEIITQTTIAATDLFSAAITLAGMFITCGHQQVGFEMSQKLRRILIVRDLALDDAFGFKCDHGVGRSSYVFIVAFEETLRGRNEICYTELVADILVETVLYEKFTQVLQVESAKAEVILSVGAQLRRFLALRKREQQLKHLDDQLYSIFWNNYSTGLPVKEHVKWTLYFTLITRMGESKSRQHSLIHHACVASDTSVKLLIQESRFEAAYELATALFQLLHSQKAYQATQYLGYGLKLSLHLASRGGLPKAADAKMAEQMLQLSKKVIQEVLDACKHHEIDLTSLELGDLNELIGLLGEQRNWIELEVSTCLPYRLKSSTQALLMHHQQYLLTTMWSSRPTDDNSWSESTTLTLARLLIQARFLHPKPSYHLSAIALAEDIAYNLRRARGSLHPDTIAAYTLLSELYTKQARYRDSMGVHEEMLRLTLCADDDDDGFEGSEDEGEGTRERIKGVVGVQVRLLKRAHLRLGGWDKSLKNYSDLFSRLKETFGKDVVLAGAGGEELKGWKVGGADDGVGRWQPPKEWRLMEKGQSQGVMVAKRDGKGGAVTALDKEKENKEGKRWSRRISRMWGVFE